MPVYYQPWVENSFVLVQPPGCAGTLGQLPFLTWYQTSSNLHACGRILSKVLIPFPLKREGGKHCFSFHCLDMYKSTRLGCLLILLNYTPIYTRSFYICLWETLRVADFGILRGGLWAWSTDLRNSLFCIAQILHFDLRHSVSSRLATNWADCWITASYLAPRHNSGVLS